MIKITSFHYDRSRDEMQVFGMTEALKEGKEDRIWNFFSPPERHLMTVERPLAKGCPDICKYSGAQARWLFEKFGKELKESAALVEKNRGALYV